MKSVQNLMISFVLVAASALANTPPEITNVRACQREGTKLVDIYYDAADADGDLLKIRVEISDNDGATYSVPAFSFTGDSGEGIQVGKDKHIVWNAGEDWDGEYSDLMRVKVYAIDAKGLAGLEWGNEVVPGGFLMGQDGGAEGSGESRHVNISWPYWLSKYEITCGQYCDFLNQALFAGYIVRSGTVEVKASDTIPLELVCNKGSLLCRIGDDENIRWNVNRFEPTSVEKTNLPVSTTWDGAIAFARFYGYDLPTDAEWEKAARGPDHDDQTEHLCYPWGNDISASYANITPSLGLKDVGFFNGNQIPVGPDTINGFGLYDVIGNVAEWTLSTDRTGSDLLAGIQPGVGVSSLPKEVASIANYPQQESLSHILHSPYNVGLRVVRGYCENPIYWRMPALATEARFYCLTGYSISSSYYSSTITPNYKSSKDPVGFRVVRRQGVNSVVAHSFVKETFNEWDVFNPLESKEYTNGLWIAKNISYGAFKVAGSGLDDSHCVYLGNGSAQLWLPPADGAVVSVRCRVKGSDNTLFYVYLCSVLPDGSTSSSSQTISDSGACKAHDIVLTPASNAKRVYLEVTNGGVYLDDLEMITIPVE